MSDFYKPHEPSLLNSTIFVHVFLIFLCMSFFIFAKSELVEGY